MHTPVIAKPNEIAIATFHAFGPAEYVVVAPIGPGRELVGQRFVLGGDNLVSIEPSVRANLGLRIPDGGRVIVAEGGRGTLEVPTWVGWVDPAGVHVSSSDSPTTPIAVPLEGGDRVALPPVVVASGRLWVPVFRARGSGGSLLLHELAPGAALKTDTVLTVPSMPKLAAAACAPQVRTRDVAMVGWVESDSRSSRVSVAIVTRGVVSYAAVDVAGVTPIGGRLAVQATPLWPVMDDTGLPHGVRVAFVAQRLELGGYAMVRADFDAKSEQFDVRTTPLDLPAMPPLHSGYVWISTNPGNDYMRVYALREDGVLMLWKDGAVASRKAHVPLDYTFPIESDGDEPSVTADGKFKLSPIRWE
jgi:hypothetical protein